MIWHIFKKDTLLLWPFVLLVAGLNMTVASLLIAIGKFFEPGNLAMLWDLLSVVALFAMSFLAMTVMHQDAIPGVRQDWLVRPVSRMDLLLAKLLFVLLLVIAPQIVVDVCTGLIAGFPLSASLLSALSRGLQVLALYGSLGMIVGALTRNAFQALVVVTIAGVVCTVLGMLISQMTNLATGIAATHLQWMVFSGWSLVAALGALVVLPLQFFRRKTTLAYSIASGGVLVALMVIWTPWHPAFALQKALSASMADNPVALAFAPDSGPFKDEAFQGSLPAEVLRRRLPAMYLPLVYTGLDSGSRLLVDGIGLRIIGADNKELYRDSHNYTASGAMLMNRKWLEISPPAPGEQATRTYSAILIPKETYNELKNQNVRLELEYSLTLLRQTNTFNIAALDVNQKIAGLGLCDARIDNDGDELQAACVSTQKMPSCTTGFLQQPAGDIRNPEAQYCKPDYSVLPTGMKVPFNFWTGELPFRDKSALVHYAVDGTRLEGAQIVMNSFEPQDHFTRSLVIPSIRLSDWEAQASLNVR